MAPGVNPCSLPAVDGAVATQVKQKAEAHLSARHAGERLMRVWGGQAGLLHSETKQSISNMLQVHLLLTQVDSLHCPSLREHA